MRSIQRALAVAGMAVVIAGGISAAPATAHTPPSCADRIGITEFQAMEDLNLRATPAGRIVGTFPKGAFTTSEVCAISATSYRACDHASRLWRKATYQGTTGYVANACLRELV